MKKQKIDNLRLWKKYQKEKNIKKKEELRNELIEIYLPLVQNISYKVAEKIKWRITPDELNSFGIEGLFYSVPKYELDRGVSFPSYCNQRIHGSILDGLRRLDKVPRSVRINNNLVEKTKRKIESEKGEKATEYEIVEKLGIEQEEYLKNIKKYNPLSFISIDGSDISSHNKQEEFKQDFLIDLIDKRNQSPDDNLLKKEFLSKLISKSFSPLEQKIIYYYYYVELTMGDIGEKLKISESRISQIHSKLLDRLKDKIIRNPDFFSEEIRRYKKKND
jgi:RNA polymerase sigma factor FliA